MLSCYLAAEAQELVVHADGAGPAAEATLFAQAQREQRDHVRTVRVHRLRQRRGVDARQGRVDVVSDVPALRLPP